MTNVRDKLIIIGVIIIAICDMALMAFKDGFQGETIIRDIVILLGTAFKGNQATQTTNVKAEVNGGT